MTLSSDLFLDSSISPCLSFSMFALISATVYPFLFLIDTSSPYSTPIVSSFWVMVCRFLMQASWRAVFPFWFWALTKNCFSMGDRSLSQASLSRSATTKSPLLCFTARIKAVLSSSSGIVYLMPSLPMRKKKLSLCSDTIAKLRKEPQFSMRQFMSKVLPNSFLRIQRSVWLRRAVCRTVSPWSFFRRALTFIPSRWPTMKVSLRETASQRGVSPWLLGRSRLTPGCSASRSKTSVSPFSMARCSSPLPLLGSVWLRLTLSPSRMALTRSESPFLTHLISVLNVLIFAIIKPSYQTRVSASEATDLSGQVFSYQWNLNAFGHLIGGQT